MIHVDPRTDEPTNWWPDGYRQHGVPCGAGAESAFDVRALRSMLEDLK